MTDQADDILNSDANEGQVEFIEPRRRLASQVGPGKGVNPYTLTRAEEALAQLQTEYERSAAAALNELSRRLTALPIDEDFNPKPFAAALRDFATDGRTYNYPFLAMIADSLSNFLRRAATNQPAVQSVVNVHIGAMRAIIADSVRGSQDQLGRELIDMLEALTGRAVKGEIRSV